MKNKYYIQRDGSFYTKKTKDEIKAEIDPTNPWTFLPILKDMNYPFYEYQWNNYLKRHGKNGVIGRYISFMRLKGMQGYQWEDSILMNAMENYREKREKEYNKMYQIIDSRGSGKTSRLMLLAKENNGILVCSNPYAMENKAHAYGLTGFDIISYSDYFHHNYDQEKMVFVDELDNYIKSLGNNLSGYSLTVGD